MEINNITRASKTQKILDNFKKNISNSSKIQSIRSPRFNDKKFISFLKGDLDLISKNTFKEELISLLFSNLDFKQIPQAILNIVDFKEYETCHVLVHEKGQALALNYYCNFSSVENLVSVSVQEFNSLFNTVKKSKNKTFNQGSLELEYVKSVGNFLAKEFDLKKFSIICIISKNTFLPTENDELERFNLIMEYLSPLFDYYLDNEKFNFNKEAINVFLNLYPENIQILKNDKIIFNNNKAILEESFSQYELSDSVVIKINNFQATEEISTERYHLERISLLGELLNTLQHELSNPLFGLNLASDMLQHETSDLETIETLKEIGFYATRSQTIIKNFSKLYSSSDEIQRIHLKTFLDEVITLTKSETKQITKTINWNIGSTKEEDIFLKINPTWLSQIIFNLIINAAQALKSEYQDLRDSKISIVITKMDHTLELSISDNGPGIEPQIENQIFNPFFTTKNSGTGLGLSICQNLAKKLGTNIILKTNNPLLGATFSINLPYISEEFIDEHSVNRG